MTYDTHKTDSVFCYKANDEVFISFGNGISASMPSDIALELAAAIYKTATNNKEIIQ